MIAGSAIRFEKPLGPENLIASCFTAAGTSVVISKSIGAAVTTPSAGRLGCSDICSEDEQPTRNINVIKHANLISNSLKMVLLRRLSPCLIICHSPWRFSVVPIRPLEIGKILKIWLQIGNYFPFATIFPFHAQRNQCNARISVCLYTDSVSS